VIYILTFVPLQMQWKKSVWISSHRAKEIVIMTGPMQQELYYFSWFTATFSVCVANLFEMEYLFIHSPVCKEQGRKIVLLFTFGLHMFSLFDDGLAICELLLQYSLQEIEKVVERDLTELIWN